MVRCRVGSFAAMPLLGLPGVPNRVVRAMFLDRKGRMWLGMERGPVVCLAADATRTFGEADGLPDARVAVMAEDREGVVWVVFSSGIYRIKDGKADSFGVAEGLPSSGGELWAADAAGELWISRGRQIGVCRDGKFQAKLTVNDSPVRIQRASSSGLWICSGAQTLKYVEGHEPEECGRLPETAKPRVLFEDHAGALWIGTAADGLFRLKDGILEKVPTSHQEVDCLSEDREGNIWAGTNGGGLDQVRPRAVALMGREAGLESVRSVCQDVAGGVWATMQNGTLAPAGTRTFQVDSTSGLAVGNTVIVKRPSTANWITDIGMDQLGPARGGASDVVPWTAGSKDLFFDRVITRIDNNWITVDAPLPQMFELSYGGRPGLEIYLERSNLTGDHRGALWFLRLHRSHR